MLLDMVLKTIKPKASTAPYPSLFTHSFVSVLNPNGT
jgi:hypothetical protein